MENRYKLLVEASARNIKEYNEKFISRRLNPEKGVARIIWIPTARALAAIREIGNSISLPEVAIKSANFAECRQADRDGAGGCGGDFELFGDRDGKSL